MLKLAPLKMFFKKPVFKKAQGSIEFVVLVGAVLFFFIAFLTIMQNNNLQKEDQEKNVLIKQIAYNIQEEISLASESSDGYRREFFLPEKIINLNYNASITEGQIYLITEDKRFSIALPVVNVTGNLTIGKNIITKKNGIIYLNEE